MNRFSIITATALTVGMAVPALAGIATTTSIEIVPVDNSAVLTGYESFDLMMTTPDSDWTGGVISLTLTAGSMYQDPVGNNEAPNPALFPYFPTIEFDTYAGVLGGNVMLGAGDLDNDTKVFSTTELSASFFNFEKTDTGTLSIGRVTLSDDAAGSWNLISLTADRQRIDLIGTIVDGGFQVDAEASAAASLTFYLNSEEYQRILRADKPRYTLKDTEFVSLFVPRSPFPLAGDAESNAIQPEPGTVVLLGLGGLALLRRR